MRRLARHLFTLCAAASLLLCLSVCALWARSYGMTDQILSRRTDGERSVRTARGHVVTAFYLGDRTGQPPEWYGLRYAARKATPPTERLIRLFLTPERGDVNTHFERMGFTYTDTRNARLGRRRTVAAVPFWGVAAVTSLLPLAWAMTRWHDHVRRRRRVRRGLCPACAYDLRATPSGDVLLPRCPECGLDAPAAPAARPRTGRRPLTAAFAAGFAAATAVCLAVVVPVSNQSVRDRIETDVYDPVSNAAYYASLSAANGEPKRAAAQLIMLIERWNAYRGFHGPAPIHWWKEVVDYRPAAPATKPAHHRAPANQ
jgi:hypothetical protein